ncbi:MAG: PDDEXK nuclease domain-containing protein [Bdellovibrionota bacterium]
MALKKRRKTKRPAKTQIVQAPLAQLPRLPKGYGKLLADLRTRIASARVKAALAVNREMVLLYWDLGRQILLRQEREGWGSKVIDRLAVDLRRAFPGMSGLSSRNLQYMRAFAEAFPEEPIVQQVVAQLPWGHIVRIMDSVKEPDDREWYVKATIEHGWSRNVLVHQIEGGLHRRQGKAISNFHRTLPARQSELAQQVLKDPYNFEFLGLTEKVRERDLEKNLIRHVREFLLELGVGFAFVGSQFPLEVEGEDFYLDLLFYHLRLRCYVVIDLKMGDFQPEHAGKMNFYLSAVDDQLRQAGDRPTIGLVLCKTRKKLLVEYALRGSRRPVGVAAYHLTTSLPRELQKSLPTARALVNGLTGRKN